MNLNINQLQVYLINKFGFGLLKYPMLTHLRLHLRDQALKNIPIFKFFRFRGFYAFILLNFFIRIFLKVSWMIQMLTISR